MTEEQYLIRRARDEDLEGCQVFQDLYRAWLAHGPKDILNLVHGPLSQHASSLIIATMDGDGHFLYTHYGESVARHAGVSLEGQSTKALSYSGASLFRSSFLTTIEAKKPQITVSRAQMSHSVHCWKRFLVPATQSGASLDTIIAAPTPVTFVKGVLDSVARDAGSLCGTVEPVIEDDQVADLKLFPVSDVSAILPVCSPSSLSQLLDNKLSKSDLRSVIEASVGQVVIDTEIPRSFERLGRQYSIRISGGESQPVFAISDATHLSEARRNAEQQRQTMKDFAEISSDWMWETDANHNMSWITDAVERATGNPASSYIGKSRMDFAMRVASDPLFKKHVEDLNAHRPFRDLIYSVTGTDGELRWIRVDGNPRFDEDGTFLGYRGTGSNITEEVEAREAAAQRAADLGEAHRLGRMGAWRYERTTRSATLSPEFLELVQLDLGLAVVPVKKLLRNFSSSTRRLIQSTYCAILRSGIEQTIDIEWELGAGRSMDLTVRVKPERDGDGRIVGVFGTVQDISERKAAERQLENLAYFDPLTGLGNRAYFARELAGRFRSLAGCRNTSNKLSSAQSGLMLLDLDHFKEVNDTLGHAAGDELLRRVADRLKRCVGPDAIVCRLGGDEFAIIMPEVQSRAAFGSLATDINAAFAGTVRLNEGAVHIATSIGLVVFPQQTSDPDEAMRFADLALYRAKEEGRSRWMFFQTEFDDEVQDRVSLAHDLRQAIHDADLDAHYQLQVDLTLGCVSGFEALARWTHPRRGIIPPSRFIPIAESSHLIADIGDWMLNEVCRQGREWLDAGGAPLEMSVNLSVAQLWHRDLEKDICKALAKHDFPAELLCIELTESVFEEEALSRIEHLLKRLKDIGVRLALDDFGTGYSSMQYLNRLSFDKLKIDRSFVQGCDTCADQRRLLQGMIGLGKGLGMDVIVEGVENEDELRVVRDLGCDAVQGFCFARPKPFHEAALAAAQVEAAYGLKPVIWRAETNNVVGDVVMKSFASAGYSRTTPSIQLPTDPRARIAS